TALTAINSPCILKRVLEDARLKQIAVEKSCYSIFLLLMNLMPRSQAQKSGNSARRLRKTEG
ncbi:MAG: hypothetical protein VZR06_18580, partial [Butyrivibrio sp.]|nr:hypothetical protein [Butyrivibrio sp.]